jgi:hypothetical protein
MGNMIGDIIRTPDAIAIPPNLGVGCKWVCLLPGKATAPLLLAKEVTNGTIEKEVIKAVKKII